MLDLPGAYSLTPTTLDEAITRDFLLGRLADEPPPEFVVCVVDATNLRLNLRLVLELRDLGVPMIVALNMSDLAHSRGYRLDRARLEQELGVPVVETVAVGHGGERAAARRSSRRCRTRAPRPAVAWREPSFERDPADAARGAPHPAALRATRSPRASARSRASTRWSCTRSRAR